MGSKTFSGQQALKGVGACRVACACYSLCSCFGDKRLFAACRSVPMNGLHYIYAAARADEECCVPGCAWSMHQVPCRPSTSHSTHDAAPEDRQAFESQFASSTIIMKSVSQQMGTQGSLARPCLLPRLCVLHSRCRSRSQAPHLQTRAIDRSMSLAAVTESHGLTRSGVEQLVRVVAKIKGQL